MCEVESTTGPDLDETISYSDADTDGDSAATFVYDESSDEDGNASDDQVPNGN